MKMKVRRAIAALVLTLALSASIVAQPASANGPSKWFHHQKKNPHQSSVHHAKPSHHATKHKSPKH